MEKVAATIAHMFSVGVDLIWVCVSNVVGADTHDASYLEVPSLLPTNHMMV